MANLAVLKRVATMVQAFRVWLAQSLLRVVRWVDVPPDQDPQDWEVRLVEAAAAAGSRRDAFDAVYQLSRELDMQVLHMVLLLLAQDMAWCGDLGGVERARSWAETRKFALMMDRMNDG